jgi:solute carrier family 41
MNLSARLSTAANIGDLDNRRVRRTLIFGNLSLLQVQALLVSAVAAVLSFVLGIMMGPTTAEPTDDSPTKTVALHLLKFAISRRRPKYHPPKAPRGGVREFFIVLTSALFSASASSLILGSFMCSLVMLCRKLQLNPDNIAPPVASALGDLLTLTLLGLISTAVYSISNGLLAVVLLALLATFLFCLFTTLRNPLVRPIIAQGWTPLLGAMAISSGAGIVLDKFVSLYDSFGMLSIVVGGIPGSVGSIYISRLSTTLHAMKQNHHEPHAAIATAGGDYSPRVRSSSLVSHGSINEVATSDPRPFVTAMALFLVALPVLIIFLAISYAVGWMSLPILFVVFFSLMFCVTVSTCGIIAQLKAL